MTVNHDQLTRMLPRRNEREATEMNVRRVIHGFILASAAQAEALGLGPAQGRWLPREPDNRARTTRSM